MKQLTTKQKLDFVKWALKEVCEGVYECGYCSFFVCAKLDAFLSISHGRADILFPELLKYSCSKDVIKYWDENVKTSILQDNQVRAIILAFLYNELAEKLKRERP